ncbi:MAG TPA: hypothetical protein VF763_12770 [Candidatus Limnocylindrales bacterium]
MTRVLVVHHDIDIADQEVDSLRRAGYDVVECVGPTGATRPCPVMHGMSCSLADRADVLVYDVWASGATGGGEALIEHLRDQYPDKPIVLTSPGLEPEWAEEDVAARVTTLLGTPTRERLQEAIERAMGHIAV